MKLKVPHRGPWHDNAGEGAGATFPYKTKDPVFRNSGWTWPTARWAGSSFCGKVASLRPGGQKFPNGRSALTGPRAAMPQLSGWSSSRASSNTSSVLTFSTPRMMSSRGI